MASVNRSLPTGPPFSKVQTPAALHSSPLAQQIKSSTLQNSSAAQKLKTKFSAPIQLAGREHNNSGCSELPVLQSSVNQYNSGGTHGWSSSVSGVRHAPELHDMSVCKAGVEGKGKPPDTQPADIVVGASHPSTSQLTHAALITVSTPMQPLPPDVNKSCSPTSPSRPSTPQSSVSTRDSPSTVPVTTSQRIYSPAPTLFAVPNPSVPNSSGSVVPFSSGADLLNRRNHLPRQIGGSRPVTPVSVRRGQNLSQSLMSLSGSKVSTAGPIGSSGGGAVLSQRRSCPTQSSLANRSSYFSAAFELGGAGADTEDNNQRRLIPELSGQPGEKSEVLMSSAGMDRRPQGDRGEGTPTLSPPSVLSIASGANDFVNYKAHEMLLAGSRRDKITDPGEKRLETRRPLQSKVSQSSGAAFRSPQKYEKSTPSTPAPPRHQQSGVNLVRGDYPNDGNSRPPLAVPPQPHPSTSEAGLASRQIHSSLLGQTALGQTSLGETGSPSLGQTSSIALNHSPQPSVPSWPLLGDERLVRLLSKRNQTLPVPQSRRHAGPLLSGDNTAPEFAPFVVRPLANGTATLARSGGGYNCRDSVVDATSISSESAGRVPNSSGSKGVGESALAAPYLRKSLTSSQSVHGATRQTFFDQNTQNVGGERRSAPVTVTETNAVEFSWDLKASPGNHGLGQQNQSTVPKSMRGSVNNSSGVERSEDRGTAGGTAEGSQTTSTLAQAFSRRSVNLYKLSQPPAPDLPSTNSSEKSSISSNTDQQKTSVPNLSHFTAAAATVPSQTPSPPLWAPSDLPDQFFQQATSCLPTWVRNIRPTSTISASSPPVHASPPSSARATEYRPVPDTSHQVPYTTDKKRHEIRSSELVSGLPSVLDSPTVPLRTCTTPAGLVQSKHSAHQSPSISSTLAMPVSSSLSSQTPHPTLRPTMSQTYSAVPQSTGVATSLQDQPTSLTQHNPILPQPCVPKSAEPFCARLNVAQKSEQKEEAVASSTFLTTTKSRRRSALDITSVSISNWWDGCSTSKIKTEKEDRGVARQGGNLSHLRRNSAPPSMSDVALHLLGAAADTVEKRIPDGDDYKPSPSSIATAAGHFDINRESAGHVPLPKSFLTSLGESVSSALEKTASSRQGGMAANSTSHKPLNPTPASEDKKDLQGQDSSLPRQTSSKKPTHNIKNHAGDSRSVRYPRSLSFPPVCPNAHPTAVQQPPSSNLASGLLDSVFSSQAESRPSKQAACTRAAGRPSQHHRLGGSVSRSTVNTTQASHDLETKLRLNDRACTNNARAASGSKAVGRHKNLHVSDWAAGTGVKSEEKSKEKERDVTQNQKLGEESEQAHPPVKHRRNNTAAHFRSSSAQARPPTLSEGPPQAALRGGSVRPVGPALHAPSSRQLPKRISPERRPESTSRQCPSVSCSASSNPQPSSVIVDGLQTPTPRKRSAEALNNSLSHTKRPPPPTRQKRVSQVSKHAATTASGSTSVTPLFRSLSPNVLRARPSKGITNPTAVIATSSSSTQPPLENWATKRGDRLSRRNETVSKEEKRQQHRRTAMSADVSPLSRSKVSQTILSQTSQSQTLTPAPARAPEDLSKSIDSSGGDSTLSPTPHPKVTLRSNVGTTSKSSQLKQVSSGKVVPSDVARGRHTRSREKRATVALPSSTTAMFTLAGFKAPHPTGRPPAPNQDQAFVLKLKSRLTVYAVFDGHGELGHRVAEFVALNFKRGLTAVAPSFLTTDETALLTLFREVFRTVDRELLSSEIDLSYSGCTASVAVRCNDVIYIGYVGDSKVAGFFFEKSTPMRVMETPEHNPNRANERRRIHSLGGTISEAFFAHLNKTVSRITQAGISVSRAFGDLEARRYGLISDPEFVRFDIPLALPTDKKSNNPSPYFPLMLLLASDGLWDTMRPQEVLEFCTNKVQSEKELMAGLKIMSATAWRRRLQAEGRADDTTAILALIC